MLKYKDFNSEAFASLLNPKRRQISLAQMINSRAIVEYFQTPHRALVISVSSRMYRGTLQYTNKDGFHFNCQKRTPTPTLRTNQLMVLVFNVEGVEYFTQIVVTHAIHSRFVFGAVPLRFHKRYEIRGPISFYAVQAEDIVNLVSGDSIIRRKRRDANDKDGVFFFVRELILKNGAEIKSYNENNTSGLSGKLLEISQSGCSFSFSSEYAQSLRATKVGYFEATVKLGVQTGNIGCFVIIKRSQDRNGVMTLRCAFLDILPLVAAELSSGANSFVLDFVEDVEVIVNGVATTVNGKLDTVLIYGQNFLRVQWPDGKVGNYCFVINEHSPRLLTVSPSLGVTASTTRQSA